LAVRPPHLERCEDRGHPVQHHALELVAQLGLGRSIVAVVAERGAAAVRAIEARRRLTLVVLRPAVVVLWPAVVVLRTAVVVLWAAVVVLWAAVVVLWAAGAS
jgi:hypothetical protein